MSHLIKKLGFKETHDFYKQLADEKLDPNEVQDKIMKVLMPTKKSKNPLQLSNNGFLL